MPPLDFEISMTEKKDQPSFGDDSVSSEISIAMLMKDQEAVREKQNMSSSSGWNPDDSDYSLNVLLHAKDGEDSDGGNDNDKDPFNEMMEASNYSLNLSRLSKDLPNVSTHSAASTVSSSSTSVTARKQRRKKKRKIRFHNRVRIQRVVNRDDMSKRQIDAVWFSRDEFHDIREDCFETIRIMTEEVHEEDHGLISDSGVCFRGLEYKTKEKYRERQRNKMDVRDAVLDEQEFQRENGMNDPEWIAKVSRDESRSCVRSAWMTAKNDEWEALQIYQEN